jgi:hypothetical protein
MNQILTDIVGAIADGRPINWDMVMVMLDQKDHHLIPQLRLLEHIMQFHTHELNDIESSTDNLKKLE